MEELELSEGLLHLVDGSGAIDELERAVGFGESVAGDKGEKGNGLTSAGGHFQEAMAFGVQGSLQLHHVRILLRIYVIVREIHRHILNLELHRFLWVGVFRDLLQFCCDCFEAGGEADCYLRMKTGWGLSLPRFFSQLYSLQYAATSASAILM